MTLSGNSTNKPRATAHWQPLAGNSLKLKATPISSIIEQIANKLDAGIRVNARTMVGDNSSEIICIYKSDARYLWERSQRVKESDGEDENNASVH